MGCIEQPKRVKLFCGMLAGDPARFEQAEGALTARFGPIDLRSADVPFTFTDYYREEMGEGLLRRFVSFVATVDPGILAAAKRAANEVEEELARVGGGGLRRPVNLDPGYVAPAKLVLASTKDFSHRVYLADGIYAEVTLQFRKGRPVFFDWTYLDFKSGAYDAFFLEVRRRLLHPG